MAHDPSSITVIIPAKNEAKTIVEVIAGVGKYANDIVVVDGHSKDDTAELARKHGARVVKDNGLGKGDAIRAGAAATDREILIFIDADGSHDPEDIPRLIEPIVKGEADMVIGSRMTGGSDELHGNVNELMRLAGSNIITVVINKRFGQHITDYQNGFRAVRGDAFRKLSLEEKHTTIEQEMSIKLLKQGFRIAEVPTHEYRRKFGASNISLLKHGPRYVYTLIKYL